MTETKPNLTKLNYATHPNLSRLVEQHVKDFPNGVVASGLQEGINHLAAPTLQFYFAHTIDHFRSYCDRAFIALEERIEKLEARPAMRDAGVWRDGEQYAAGDVTTHSGSCWVCKSFNIGQRPGSPEGSTFWRLLVKRGRDARDKT